MATIANEQDLHAILDQHPRMQKTVQPQAEHLPDLMKAIADELLNRRYKPQFYAESDLAALQNVSAGTNGAPFVIDSHNRLFKSMCARLDGMKP